ncbi:DinB family protein [Flavihumibacter solisilvae]|uniref:DinB-like domain-containing protein n=1 Tax=Flavihumibacter solisilvae TaxID=1349421 RepID=A0A0C1L769_9BACT|nr:DinB family protein [Flavihumibacter solisilvae]KIC95351.1 hypothetical protein OI18_07065 [Flavihumibacter solisilvae]
MKKILLETLANSRAYTLAVAAAMPADKYDFKPNDAVWNFGEQLDHIAYGIRWWQDNFISGRKTEWAPPKAEVDREKVIGHLTKAYADLEKLIRDENVNNDVVKGFYATNDHITHHRGQAVTYLRCQGIAAPEYVF